MRSTFINTLIEMARKNDNIYLLTADIGFSLFERFEKEFGERFINVGISEAAMIGIAAGLAISGKKVFVYSIIPFVTMRCFEQIRVDLCYQNLDVTIVGVGGGLSYSTSGATHQAIEDISIMRSLPNMKVICPADPFETKNAIMQIEDSKGPAYVRLNRNNEPILYNKNSDGFNIGKGIKLIEGSDIAIIATGNMLETAIRVSNKLYEDNISVKLISMHTIKPIDKNLIMECIEETKWIFTLEEHSVYGGLGSAIAEVICSNIYKIIKFKSFAISDVYTDCAGSTTYLRKQYGLDQESIVAEIKNLINTDVIV